MFNGMMDPELMRMAQEQMSRMSPADFTRIQQQMMSNPELFKMASESMQNLRPEDIKVAAEQLKHTRPEEMAEISEKMAKASPEEIASMRATMDAQMSYEISAAEMLKKQGNDLFSQGKYNSALEKYIRAKKNLKAVPSSKGRNILLACSCNMMSCYLKTQQFDECVNEGMEVLAYDPKNIKALYRKGQAYKNLGKLEEAVSDLTRAHELCPDDETVAEVLREAEERLIKEGGTRPSKGLVIEEIIDEATASSSKHENSTSENRVSPPQVTNEGSPGDTGNHAEPTSTNTDYLEALKDDQESIRSFQDFISRSDPETLSAISGGKDKGISPDMLKTASTLVGKMSPEELKKMFELASSSSRREDPFSKSGSSFSPGSVPSNLSPEMLKTASDMMAKMSPEEIQKMFEMASSLKRNDSSSSSSGFPNSPGLVPSNVTPDMIKMASEMMGKMSPEERQKMAEIAASLRGQEMPQSSATSSVSNGFRSNDGSTRENVEFFDGSDVGEDGLSSGNSPQPSFPSSTGDLQEQMMQRMKDPAIRKMLTSMMKNISPEMMANMSEQYGLNLSREDAEKAHQAISSLSPESLDTMMRWADRIQGGVAGARKTKNWLLGKPGMVLAILMLLLAVILHWFGFIGR